MNRETVVAYMAARSVCRKISRSQRVMMPSITPVARTTCASVFALLLIILLSLLLPPLLISRLRDFSPRAHAHTSAQAIQLISVLTTDKPNFLYALLHIPSFPTAPCQESRQRRAQTSTSPSRRPMSHCPRVSPAQTSAHTHNTRAHTRHGRTRHRDRRNG